MAPLEQKVRSSPRLQRTMKVTTPRKHTPKTCSRIHSVTPRGFARQLKDESAIKPNIKQKENKGATAVGNSAVKRRGPKAAHSGVPVPDKMRKLLDKLNREEGLKMGPKTPLKSSTVLKTLTPKPTEKKLSTFDAKATGNVDKDLSKSLPIQVKKLTLSAHSGIPLTDKMRKLKGKNTV